MRVGHPLDAGKPHEMIEDAERVPEDVFGVGRLVIPFSGVVAAVRAEPDCGWRFLCYLSG